jgi:hypothetical protein
MMFHRLIESAALIGDVVALVLNASGTGRSASFHKTTADFQICGKKLLQLAFESSVHTRWNACVRLTSTDDDGYAGVEKTDALGTSIGRSAVDDTRFVATSEKIG